jgi:hypothetical protein
MIEPAIYALLTETPGVAALVGTRVYPVVLPQNPTMPAITYQRTSAQRTRSTLGPSGLTRSGFQIDCWSASYLNAKSLCAAVRAAIDGYRETVTGPGVTEGNRMGAVMVEGDRDFREESPSLYRVSIDITVWHEE